MIDLVIFTALSRIAQYSEIDCLNCEGIHRILAMHTYRLPTLGRFSFSRVFWLGSQEMKELVAPPPLTVPSGAVPFSNIAERTASPLEIVFNTIENNSIRAALAFLDLLGCCLVSPM